MANKRGNQGYGKVEMVRQNFDKFSPRFWELMEAYSTSGDPDKERLFITEFNKIQTKMIPTEIGGPDGGDIKVTITNYGNSPAAQVHAEDIPATITPSD